MSKIETINSDLITLKEMVTNQYIFYIPIYQRLYVWKQEQVQILLDDMYDAFKSGRDTFYLGGVLVVGNENNEYSKLFDLIDGQQRFTTLWMISIVFRNELEQFVELVSDEDELHRVNFSIRTDIKDFFNIYMKDNKTSAKSTTHIMNALGIIETFKDKYSVKEITAFSQFIFEKIQLLFTTVPQTTDLNKLFEIINNRGVQLQHHEILKAKLLNVLPSEDRKKYSHLWDACSYMENYVEKNIRDVANIKISELYDNDSAKMGTEELASSHKVLAKITTLQNIEFKPLSLIEILTHKEEYHDKNQDKIVDEEYESDNNVRSIITFSMLLQHTLRLHLFRNREENEDIPKILDKELLSIFNNCYFNEAVTANEVKAFIELLWEVRYLFDKHVIKWVETEDGEIHLINKLYKAKNKKYFTLTRRKPDKNKGVALLQSMLYHSQQLTTHYWLTPYLNYLLEYKGKNNYKYLRFLDNHLLSSHYIDSLIKRTYNFLENPYIEKEIDYSILNEPEGTSFAHYWFYKLEFVLWYLLKNTRDSRWKEFRFTAKNSVEHISPQTPQDTDTNRVSKEVLNTFGNLSLVSRSINSEYSNLPYNEKRQRFFNKNKVKLDSLKMDIIYAHEHWNDNFVKSHQQEMLNLLEQYFQEEVDFNA